MKTINLKFYYPWYTENCYIRVADDVAAELQASRKDEAAQKRRASRHQIQCPLDCEELLEYFDCPHEPSPHELLQREELSCRLWRMLGALPEDQRRRVDARVLHGKSYKEIAVAEGIKVSEARYSVLCGLERMKKYLLKERTG